MTDISYMPGKGMKEFTITLSSDWFPAVNDTRHMLWRMEDAPKRVYQPQRPLKLKIPMMPIVVDSRNDAYTYYFGSDGTVYYNFIYSLIEEENEK